MFRPALLAASAAGAASPLIARVPRRQLRPVVPAPRAVCTSHGSFGGCAWAADPICGCAISTATMGAARSGRTGKDPWPRLCGIAAGPGSNCCAKRRAITCWPLDHRDSGPLRFVNKRNPANMRMGGTHSVRPQRWAGATEPRHHRCGREASSTPDQGDRRHVDQPAGPAQRWTAPELGRSKRGDMIADHACSTAIGGGENRRQAKALPVWQAGSRGPQPPAGSAEVGVLDAA